MVSSILRSSFLGSVPARHLTLLILQFPSPPQTTLYRAFVFLYFCRFRRFIYIYVSPLSCPYFPSIRVCHLFHLARLVDNGQVCVGVRRDCVCSVAVIVYLYNISIFSGSSYGVLKRCVHAFCITPKMGLYSKLVVDTRLIVEGFWVRLPAVKWNGCTPVEEALGLPVTFHVRFNTH
ncbi:hypothetical protein GYMLUDRAFT_752580 [Collybiopsis luxurians FD-317 M1]|uniref:Unplaced genomic scaffold GYMLUscaffold_42, whole genome shotgun sequence n=1 Tax=Collybiopsis luxurians FD-317 M1 TaxID=944289 RepID=A0A0D0BQV6_9AGAR|nr:hypothetical protein GYMLUDRAFT_752580 [Collybiopsis luxurians FD-317 M1]